MSIRKYMSIINEFAGDTYAQAVDDMRWLIKASKDGMRYQEEESYWVQNAAGKMEYVTEPSTWVVDYGSNRAEHDERQARLDRSIQMIASQTGKTPEEVQTAVLNDADRPGS